MRGYVGYAPFTPEGDDRFDYFTFTVPSPLLPGQGIRAVLSNLSGGPDSAGIEIFRDTNGNGAADAGERVAGYGIYSGVVTQSIDTYLDAGTYYLGVYAMQPEHDAWEVMTNYTLTYNLSTPSDVTSPSVLSAQFHREAKPHRLSVQFSEDVGASLSATDFELYDASNNRLQPVDLGWDPGTNRATLSFPALFPGGQFSQGRYRLSIPAGSGVFDSAGNPLAAAFNYNFHLLPGDANDDATVDISDLGILATNWQSHGMSFSQGDFNYDGVVDISDLGILATSWQKTLAAPTQPTAAKFRSPVPGRSPFASPPLIVAKTRRSLAEDILN